MPLVMQAYLAVAAGLLMGSGGEVFLCLGVAGIGAAASAWRRSGVVATLACLTMAAGVMGCSVARADERCATAIEREGRATVRLREPASTRATARGIALGAGCRVGVRIRVAGGSGAAGATVHVRG